MSRARRIREFALIVILAYGLAWSIRGITFATTPRPIQPITVGEIFPLDHSELPGARSLVLVTSDKCPYSRASESFHKRLIDAAHLLHVPLLVLTDTKVSIPAGISSSLGNDDRVMKMNLAPLRIQGTPTVLLVEDRRVTGSWVGFISEQQENGLLARLDGTFHTLTRVAGDAQVLKLKPEELSGWLGRSHILDIRSRDQFQLSHLQGAANIPSDEMGARMQVELREDGKALVIDCRAMDMGVCQGNAKLLEWGGLKQIWLLDAGAVGSACSMSPL